VSSSIWLIEPSWAPHRAREVPEVVDRQRQVGGHRLADRLAVVPGLGHREHLEVGLDPVGDLEQDVAPLGDRGTAPRRRRGVRGVQDELDVLGGAARDLGERLTVDRRHVLEVLPLDRGDPLAADPVVVAASESGRTTRLTRGGIHRHVSSSSRRCGICVLHRKPGDVMCHTIGNPTLPRRCMPGGQEVRNAEGRMCQVRSGATWLPSPAGAPSPAATRP
jgi:hypothetical protein